MVDFGGVDARSRAFSSRVPRPKAVPAEELFARAAHAAVMVQKMGLDVTVETMRGVYPDLPLQALRDLMDNPMFIDALLNRGVEISAAGRRGLSVRQLNALAIFMDMTAPMNFSQRLRAAKVTSKEFDGWMQQPAFAREMSSLSEQRLQDAQPLALKTLSEKAIDGERWAMELFLEMTGRHDRRAQSFDVKNLLTRVYGILDERLASVPGGDEILGEIGEEIRALMRTGLGQQAMMVATPAAPAANLEIQE